MQFQVFISVNKKHDMILIRQYFLVPLWKKKKSPTHGSVGVVVKFLKMTASDIMTERWHREIGRAHSSSSLLAEFEVLIALKKKKWGSLMAPSET